MAKLFGTDGIRGVAGKDLTVDLAMKIGKAVATVTAERVEGRPLFVVGMDTRVSSVALKNAVMAGLCSASADVLDVGVISTPGVAYLLKKYGADGGVMISASHNSYEYNGIKVFGGDGYKLTDDAEKRVESLIRGSESFKVATHRDMGSVQLKERADEEYSDYLSKLFAADGFTGKILIDCANGSASATAPTLFKRLGLNVTMISSKPNGYNINENCGSTYLGTLASKVTDGGYDIGIAFDGDADRMLCVDKDGNEIDGDHLIYIYSDYLKSLGKLTGDTAVVTVMSNMGLFKALDRLGVTAPQTKVGDRYVLEHMRAKGFVLGGEQSGHTIFLEHGTTGDGQLSAIMLINALSARGVGLKKYASEMKKFPQLLVNLDASAEMKEHLPDCDEVNEVIAQYSKKLGDSGRLLIRPSGTEPLIRVMGEAEDEELMNEAVKAVCDAIEKYLV